MKVRWKTKTKGEGVGFEETSSLQFRMLKDVLVERESTPRGTRRGGKGSWNRKPISCAPLRKTTGGHS